MPRKSKDGDWWQNYFGEWRRGEVYEVDPLNGVFNRFAEDYVRGTYKTAEHFEAALDRYIVTRNLVSR
jgi:hypothetical protein